MDECGWKSNCTTGFSGIFWHVYCLNSNMSFSHVQQYCCIYLEHIYAVILLVKFYSVNLKSCQTAEVLIFGIEQWLDRHDL